MHVCWLVYRITWMEISDVSTVTTWNLFTPFTWWSCCTQSLRTSTTSSLISSGDTRHMDRTFWMRPVWYLMEKLTELWSTIVIAYSLIIQFGIQVTSWITLIAKAITPLKYAWKSCLHQSRIFSSLWAPGIRRRLHTTQARVSSFSRRRTRTRIYVVQRSRTRAIRRRWSCATLLAAANSGRSSIVERFLLEMPRITSL